MRLRRTLLAAVLLAALLPAETLAASWGTTLKLTSSRNALSSFGLVTTGSNVVHAVFEDAKGGIRGVYYRRSGDGGQTWAAAVRLSNAASEDSHSVAIASYGSQLDVVWLDLTEPDWGHHVVKYRRSLDQGMTWQGTLALGGSECCATTPNIAHDSTGRVIVTWTNESWKNVNVQISGDGGVHWGAVKTLGTTSYETSVGRWNAFPAVAAGTGVIYVTWLGAATVLYAQKSTDGGATWSAKATLTSAAAGNPPSIAATGSTAIVTYAESSPSLIWVSSRRTTNKGGTWASRVALTSTTSGNPAFNPVIRFTGGRWRVALERCGDATLCLTSAAWYRDSSDGVSWTTIQKVSTSTRPYSTPTGVATASGRVIVLYYDLNFDTLDSDVFVRLGTS